MKNRTILSLIEMLIMVMVFAVAAAICLRAFVWADLTSRDSKEAAAAALKAEEAAEILQHFEGDPEAASETYGGEVSDDAGASDGNSGIWVVGFDSDWQIVPAEAAVYCLRAEPVDSDEADGNGADKADAGANKASAATASTMNAIYFPASSLTFLIRSVLPCFYCGCTGLVLPEDLAACCCRFCEHFSVLFSERPEPFSCIHILLCVLWISRCGNTSHDKREREHVSQSPVYGSLRLSLLFEHGVSGHGVSQYLIFSIF